jgi:hypothetical protein
MAPGDALMTRSTLTTVCCEFCAMDDLPFGDLGGGD